ncbi:hypothetical protein DUT91_10605 [Phyllobacterium salinisoli]|uniref:Fimbrial protein n=1 Tax=Phyllobacterium salinisoli TaxID=1899321 RepID=A0A368K6Q4_9HYPH|nr:hypothetical protein [Phyllobacterium salinisoli]RCS23730.1 hypothetical protein DUT91_10605 [Phyllobacterium salinisoli]
MQDRYHHQGYPDHQAYPGANPEEPPLDPAMERVRRKMMRLLAVSIGVMLIGLMAVLAAVVYKVTRPDDAQTTLPRPEIPGQAAGNPDIPPAIIESEIPLTPGTRLLSQSLSGDHVSLETLLPDGGTEIVIYDFRKSRIIARMRVGSPGDGSNPE